LPCERDSFCVIVVNYTSTKNWFQGIAAEKREAKAEKEEADKYHKLNQELVSHLIISCLHSFCFIILIPLWKVVIPN